MKRFAVIACITATLLLVAVVVALLVAQTVCAGQRSEDPVHYSVHGRGVSRGQALAGGGHTWIYSVQVNDCRWRIRIMPLDFVEQGLSQAPAPLTILPDYLEAAFDGENYFQVKSFQSTSVPKSRHSHGLCIEMGRC